MEILYNFIAYKNPKIGIFQIMTGEYNGKWVCEDVSILIIGEIDDCYIEKLVDSGHGEWVGDEVIQHIYTIPIGPHKTRFVRWESTQLTLF